MLFYHQIHVLFIIMKYLIAVTVLTLAILSQTQEVKMKGKYKMEYDYIYVSQNGTINFNGSTYVRKLINGKKIKGNVDYQKYAILLNDNNSSLQVKFPIRAIGNDTIYFRTIDLNDKSVNNNPLSVYAGKLIKVK